MAYYDSLGERWGLASDEGYISPEESVRQGVGWGCSVGSGCLTTCARVEAKEKLRLVGGLAWVRLPD